MLTAHDFKIITEDDGFVVINLQKYRGLKQQFSQSHDGRERAWKMSHSHIKSYQMVLIIRDNLIKKKLPKTKNGYLLRSYLRLSDDPQYQQKIQQLILQTGGKANAKRVSSSKNFS